MSVTPNLCCNETKNRGKHTLAWQEDSDKSSTDSEPGKARWLVKRNPEESPHESDSNDRACGTLSEPVCVSIHGYFTLFPPNKHFASLLFVFVGILFRIAKEPSLLMALILHASCHYPTSVSGNRSPASSCFKLRPPEIKVTEEERGAINQVLKLFIVSLKNRTNTWTRHETTFMQKNVS